MKTNYWHLLLVLNFEEITTKQIVIKLRKKNCRKEKVKGLKSRGKKYSV